MRHSGDRLIAFCRSQFPRLRVGTFIEATNSLIGLGADLAFPRLRVGTFIEADNVSSESIKNCYFPAFGWGLSLRRATATPGTMITEFPRLRVGTFIEAPAV